jgi:type II secretory pathway pseudopilin PulG
MVFRNTRGFSFIEVTIATGIIGLMIVATGTFLGRVPANGREFRDLDVALRIARNEIEALRAGGYAALPASGPFANDLLSSLASSSASVAVSAYGAETKRVDVSVSWSETNASPRSVSLTTLITQTCGLP